MTRLAIVALAAVAAGAGPTATAGEAGRFLADRLEARDLTAPRPTVPGIGTLSKTPGRFRSPGSSRTFTKEPGDFESPVFVVPVWDPRKIRCTPGYRCNS